MSVERQAIERLIHEQTVRRLSARIFDQPIINNAERGAYVECLIEFALHSADPRWELTGTWDSWDLQHRSSRARLEVKQSSYLQSWRAGDTSGGTNRRTFDIQAHAGFWDLQTDGEAHWVETPLMRHADVYVFAWHGHDDPTFADHRLASQWDFYVVAERELPDQKRIGLRPLQRLAGEPTSFDELARRVTLAVDALPMHKATASR